ncbi:MAG: adenosylcobinamide-phosphate synthase CbiB [Hyphomicrobium sp.]|jgi:adenosylcobinamide-phosphate synthase|uniref:adenosylcobinamide-phosphate synthase CbiB n=1 Tax=Hyphomicrobium sp. TaxID=82 RepID=UPI0025BC8172|nr:adenosylcobinamide-phosphate synthase CbiB [Hyphomicrobium sp.]MBX9861688.1 adenosylcobinamide-phosphate synthase CbiB [Hyphomicrobium sp.]
MTFALAFLALFIEALVGYSDALVARIGHPVTWIGALISRAEQVWNEGHLSPARARLRGILALATVLLVVVSIVLLIDVAIDLTLPLVAALILKAALASTLLAGRSLDEHVSDVAVALEERGLAAGRQAVSRIVGRDPASLDEAGVARAAIESLAENFSDGVVAPVFWLIVGGLPGCAAYKAANTADSMIGHKSERFFAFGWAAARFDDLINLPASRLTAIWIALAARVTQGADWRSAVHSALSDAPRHRSPNAGWPEAAMAGALGLALAGPRSYGGKTIDDAWMGSGRRDATAADIHRALRLYRIAYLIQAAVIGLLAIVAFLLW